MDWSLMKGEMYSPPKLGGEPQYTSIGSSYWTDQYSEYFTLPDVLATVFSIGISIHGSRLQGRSIENPRRSSHTIAASF